MGLKSRVTQLEFRVEGLLRKLDEICPHNKVVFKGPNYFDTFNYEKRCVTCGQTIKIYKDITDFNRDRIKELEKEIKELKNETED